MSGEAACTYFLSKRRDMKRRQASLLLVGWLLVRATPALAEPTPDEVIAAIKKLRGKVEVDENKAVVR